MTDDDLLTLIARHKMRRLGLLVEVDGQWYATRLGKALADREERRERIHYAAFRRWSWDRRRAA